jgi:hypothetical protein
MTSRRGPSHVRHRPPSSGRPSQPIKFAAPDRRRVRAHRGLDARRPRAPLTTRTLLGLSVIALAAAAFLVASGGIGPMLGALAGGFTSAFDRLVATPVPTQTNLPPTNSPLIAQPAQPYTNEDTVELGVTVPLEAVGDPSAKVRIYLALEGLEPAPVLDAAVGTTSRLSVQLQLTNGRNDISATLYRGNTESEFSPTVTYILDKEPPKLTISSPKNNASINTPNATIKGTTQAGTTITARNDANGSSINAVAASSGSFEFSLPLAPGSNAITISGTDPAGNQASTKLTVVQGSTKMGVQLTASVYRISVAHHPGSLQLVVLVTDPTGAPLAGATAFFTLQVPGLGPISNQLTTSADGRAIFTTPLVGTLTTGSGVGTVLVSHDLYGQSTDRVTLTFVK